MERIIKETARMLRMDQTKSESIFWEYVRNRKLLGKKFFGQHPFKYELDGTQRFFLADFYCPEHKLVIELDGNIHDRQKDYDEARTYIIEQLGMRVIRFKNEEIENNIEAVLGQIKTHLQN